MKWFLRWIPAAVLSVIIAVLLSFVSQMDLQYAKDLDQNDSQKTVFVQQHIQLSNHNLVDQLSGLSLNHSIRRVDWKGSILSVDLKIDQKSQKIDTYQDMFLLSHFAFSQTDNVNQLLIRIMDANSDEMLLALDGKRQQWDKAQAKQVFEKKLTVYDFLSDSFRIMQY